jgi:hypothetical protein
VDDFAAHDGAAILSVRAVGDRQTDERLLAVPGRPMPRIVGANPDCAVVDGDAERG